MPVLSNAKHEAVVQSYLADPERNGSRAYQQHYPNCAPNVAAAAFSRLLKGVNFAARIAELQEATAEKAVLKRTWVIERLVENVERAMQARQATSADGAASGEYRYEGSVANRGLELLGKELGMFVDRKEVGSAGEFKQIENMNADELRAYVAQCASNLGLRDIAPAKRGRGGKARE